MNVKVSEWWTLRTIHQTFHVDQTDHATSRVKIRTFEQALNKIENNFVWRIVIARSNVRHTEAWKKPESSGNVRKKVSSLRSHKVFLVELFRYVPSLSTVLSRVRVQYARCGESMWFTCRTSFVLTFLYVLSHLYGDTSEYVHRIRIGRRTSVSSQKRSRNRYSCCTQWPVFLNYLSRQKRILLLFLLRNRESNGFDLICKGVNKWVRAWDIRERGREMMINMYMS